MFRCRNFLVGIISLYFLTFTLLSHAEDEIEDLIDIVESGDEIIAIVEGKKTVTYHSKPNEMVLWTGYQGKCPEKWVLEKGKGHFPNGK